MGPRVFFCFDHEHDYARALAIRAALGYPDDQVHGFFTQKETREIAQLGERGIKTAVRDHLGHTDVTLILIGSQTARVRWVQYGIERSLKRHNGLVGLFIHAMEDEHGQTSDPGRKPPVPWDAEFPAHTWDGDIDRVRKLIDLSAHRAAIVRAHHKKRRGR